MCRAFGRVSSVHPSRAQAGLPDGGRVERRRPVHRGPRRIRRWSRRAAAMAAPMRRPTFLPTRRCRVQSGAGVTRRGAARALRRAPPPARPAIATSPVRPAAMPRAEPPARRRARAVSARSTALPGRAARRPAAAADASSSARMDPTARTRAPAGTARSPARTVRCATTPAATPAAASATEAPGSRSDLLEAPSAGL